MTWRRAWAILAMVLVSVLAGAALTGCTVQVPTDPEGTLERVTGGVLRVGASPHGELVRIDDGTVSGREAELVLGFARSIGAEVQWTVGGEESLVGALEHHELDLVVGGLTEATPWAERVGATRGYPNPQQPDGPRLVWLAPMGENRFISALEAHLDEAAS